MHRLYTLAELERFTGIPAARLEDLVSSGKLSAERNEDAYRVAAPDMAAIRDQLVSQGEGCLEKGLGPYPADLYSSQRSDDLYKAANCYGFAGDTERERELSVLAKVAGFATPNAVMDTDGMKEWGRFAPVSTSTYADGTIVANPDPRQVSDADVEVVARYREMSSDIAFRTRCADYLYVRKWGGRAERRNVFRSAIEGYLDLATRYLANGGDWWHCLIAQLRRSTAMCSQTHGFRSTRPEALT